jgi:CheY-like chemotaxis protein
MNDDILKYLSNIVNKEENMCDLLLQVINKTKSKVGALFIRKNDSNEYKCVEHINLEKETIDVSKVFFKPTDPICNIVLDNMYYVSPYKTNNLISIPINIKNKNIGVLCLANKNEKYKEEIIVDITPYISLFQLIINKNKIELDNDANICKYKDLFLANMSHEIRTPLNGIIGYNQLLLQQTILNSSQRNYLESMNKCSLQLMQIINDVLDFSKLASGKMSVNFNCFSVNELVSSVFDAMDQRFKEKRQNYDFVVDKNMSKFIVSDKQRLIQILVNLVSNANKFTDVKGSIKVEFKLIENDRLRISVKDNGIGISPVNQCKIFNPFEQLNADEITGTGLGLAISKKMITLMGGELNLKSSIGNGSLFHFSIPYNPCDNFDDSMKKDSELLKNKTILIVDDNADNRILLSEIMFEWGMKPVVCASALEALRMILGNRHNFDLGLIDICMPGISGIELAGQIKKEKPLFPLIALSSADTFINISNFEEKIDKPINKILLFNAIHSVILNNNSDCSESEIVSDVPVNINTSSDSFNKNSKILIIEDILYNRNLLINIMESLGYKNLQYSENGKIAYDLLKESHELGEPYDIILLDLRMPVMNGFDLITKINKKGWRLPKIVVITASVMEVDKFRCEKLGVKYFINKPINLHELKKTILHVSKSL